MISPSWGLPPRSRHRSSPRARLFSRIRRSTRSSGNPDVARDPKEPRPCGSRSPSQGRCAPGPSFKIATTPAPGPRSRASAPTLCRRMLGVLPRSWRRVTEPSPDGAFDPPQAVGQSRADRRGHSSATNRKGPKVSVLASSNHAWSTLRSGFMALSSSAGTGSALRGLSRGGDPGRSLSHAKPSRKILRPTGAPEVAPAASRKSRRTTSRGAPPSIAVAKSQRA